MLLTIRGAAACESATLHSSFSRVRMGDSSTGPQKTVVLDVVGLSRNLISPEHTPFLHGYLEQSDVLGRDVEPAFPALTCPAQSTYLSGTGPTTHGITANVRHRSYHMSRMQEERI